MTSLRDWKPGDDIRDNAHQQQAVDALRPLTPLLVEPPLGIHTGRNGSTITLELPAINMTSRMAKIWEDGNATDPTDARYKVKWLDLSQSQAQSGINGKLSLIEDQIKLEDESHTPAEPWPAFATNISELPPAGANGTNAGGTHALAKNTVVSCWPTYDGQSGEHWWFDRAPDYIVKVSTQIAHGRYSGFTMSPPTNDAALTGDLVAGDLGKTNVACLILGLLEVGNSGTNTKGIDPAGRQVYHHAKFRNWQADGKPVLTVNQVQDKTCS